MVVLAVLLAAVGCSTAPEDATAGDGGSASPSSSPSSSSPPLTEVLSVDFGEVQDVRDGLLLGDGTGRVYGARLKLVGEASSVRVLPGPSGGNALQFPAPCEAESCPRAIVEVLDAGDLSPGRRDFDLTAVLRVEPGQTSSGANVAQKGFSTGGGGQWKLQVDGEGGFPSCVLVATSASTAEASRPDERHVVTAAESVSDGEWHEVVCSRRGDVLSVSVDAGAPVRGELPAGLDVRPKGPVRIGGKNLQLDNDQFSGALKRVSLDVQLGPGPTP